MKTRRIEIGATNTPVPVMFAEFVAYNERGQKVTVHRQDVFAEHNLITWARHWITEAKLPDGRVMKGQL